MEDSAQPEVETEMETAETATEQGGGGGGGGGGGKGVGNATGGLNNTVEYKIHGNEVTIVIHSSRLCILKQAEYEDYCIFDVGSEGHTIPADDQLHVKTMLDDDMHQQVLTPWFLVDSNAWGCWLSPQEFQTMTSICSEINLESLEQEIENIVLKTVVEQTIGNQTVRSFINDLTATVQIALDSNNTLPFTPAAPLTQTLGFVPWRPTGLTQWRYYHTSYTWDRWFIGDAHGHTHREVKYAHYPYLDHFITVENNVPIHVCRTGDNFKTGRYQFKTKPCKLTVNTQSTRTLGLPPLAKPKTDRIHTLNILGDGGELVNVWGNVQSSDEKARPGHFWGEGVGPFHRETTRVRPFNVGYQIPEWVLLDGLHGSHIPGGPRGWSDLVPARPDLGGKDQTFPKKWVYDHNHGADNKLDPTNDEIDEIEAIPIHERQKYKTTRDRGIIKENKKTNQNQHQDMDNVVYDGWMEEGYPCVGQTINEDEAFFVDRIDFTQPEWGSLHLSEVRDIARNMQKYLNTYQPTVGADHIGPCYPWGQIWDKKPDLDHKPSMTNDAPFICKNNPPGQLLIKITPNLPHNYDTLDNMGDKILTYGTFHWKGKLILKGKLAKHTQWNPRKDQFIGDPGVTEIPPYKFIPNNQGHFEMPLIYGRRALRYAY